MLLHRFLICIYGYSTVSFSFTITMEYYFVEFNMLFNRNFFIWFLYIFGGLISRVSAFESIYAILCT